MTDELTGPELFKHSTSHLRDVIDPQMEDQDDTLFLRIAQVQATNANTAALVMLAGLYADAHGIRNRELEVWSEAIPPSPLVECWGKDARRPQCAERHTDDCDYADPVLEPKHVLLPVGTRVLVSEPEYDEAARKVVWKNPQAGRISGYDMGRTRYRWQHEYGPGHYTSHDSWAFVDNRVVVHPDGPECPPVPIPAGQFEPGTMWRMRKPNTGGKGEFVTVIRRTRDPETNDIMISFDRGADMPEDYRHETWPAAKFTEWYERYEEPTGPRIYVQNLRGKQGHIVDIGKTDDEGPVRMLVQWFAPGARPVWRKADMLSIIAAEDVDRCPSGQTRDECGSGENQCELCLEEEDAEGDEIERSMGLR